VALTQTQETLLDVIALEKFPKYFGNLMHLSPEKNGEN
jgi:hypothetical protein